MNHKRLKIFTWHIHGTYLYYLSQGNFDIFIPVNDEKNEGYYGRGETFPFGNNVIEVAAGEVQYQQFDCILFQTAKNFVTDQFDVLSEAQRQLPKVYVEHNTPPKSAADEVHMMKDKSVVMVHVTNFNKLMWNNDACSIVKVIDHGIMVPPYQYTGDLEKGVVIVNHLHQRGRKLGADIFKEVSRQVPLDLVGMGTKEYGGLGEVLHPQMPEFISQYRFCFNPIRWTSLGLAFLEAMAAGVPVVALATTEYTNVIKDGVNGFIGTNIDYLVSQMQLLLSDKTLATNLGKRGRKTIEERFSIQRFASDWEQVFSLAIQNKIKTYEEENSVY